MEHVEGDLEGKECQIAIVVSRFNETVTARLLAGATAAFEQLGTPDDHIHVFHVPGAFELPLIAKTLGQSKRFDAIVCLGCVIRGDTPHFDYISAEASRGISHAALQTGIPTVFGVLTTDSVEQAMQRSDSSGSNKGADAARTAVEMIRLMKKISEHHVPQLGFLK